MCLLPHSPTPWEWEWKAGLLPARGHWKWLSILYTVWVGARCSPSLPFYFLSCVVLNGWIWWGIRMLGNHPVPVGLRIGFCVSVRPWKNSYGEWWGGKLFYISHQWLCVT
jgi:hypothetical protein